MLRIARIPLAILVISALMPVTQSWAASPAAAKETFAAREVLVKFKAGTPGESIANAHRQAGGQPTETISGIDVQIVRVPPGLERASAAAYQRNPNVSFAETNAIAEAVWEPTDPMVGQQWQYNSGSGSDIEAFSAWDITIGNPSVTIAMLDTGISHSQPDVFGKVLKEVNFTTSPTVDDVNGHGTHTAGSAAASTNNAAGVAGTCPKCMLYNVKVLGDDKTGRYSWLAQGITWATDNGAQVISMSVGGTSASRTLKAAVDYAWDNGVVLAAAAGNYGSDSPFYPAYYGNAIAVAASDAKDTRPSWSNYGSWVDVAAPGVSILSTLPGGNYGTKNGTSMATPHVAGLAGLIYSQGACEKSNACVRKRIEANADPVPGTGTFWTHGRINAYRSLSVTTSTPSAAPAPSLAIANVSVKEGRRNTVAAKFAVSLSAATSQVVSLRYATADGTATTTDRDYLAASDSLVFNPGEVSKTIVVSVVGDRKQEADETFLVIFSSPTNATLASTQAVGTIVNDD